MANSSNAYATERPLQTSITDWVAKQADMDLAYKQEKRLADAEAEKKRADRDKKLQDFIANTPKFSSTGVETIDRFAYEGVQGAIEDLHTANTAYNKLRDKDFLTPEEKEEFYNLGFKIKNLRNYPENLKQLMDSRTRASKDYLDGVSKGIYLSDPEINKRLSSALTGYIPGRDSSGMPTAGVYDKDGDGIVDILTFDDINNNLNINPVKQKDPFALVSEFAKTYKADTNKFNEGYNVVENTVVDEEQAEATINGFLDEDALKTIAHKRGLGINYQWEPEEIRLLKEDLKLDLKNRVAETTSNIKNYEDENADQKRADDKVQDAIKNAQKNRELNQKDTKESNDVANEREKNAIARAKAGLGSALDSTPFVIDGSSVNSVFKGNEKADGKVVIRNGSIGFAVQGDGLERIIGSGDKAIVQQANGVFYNPKTKVLTVRANETNGFDDKDLKSINPKTVYHGSNGNASQAFSFFKNRLNKYGKPYKNITEVVNEYDKAYREKQKNVAKIAGVDIKTSNSKKYTNTQESAIKEALKSNPGYTRQEIIEALKF